MTAPVRAGPAGAQLLAAEPEFVPARAFADRVAQTLVPAGRRLLHLTRVPAQPGRDCVAALYDGEGGPALVMAPLGDHPTRPSALGVDAALRDELQLEREGLRWAEPAPAFDVLGRGVFTFPLGPVRGDVSEAAAWRLEVMGDEVLGLRLRFGYKPRRLEAAMSAAGPEAGILTAERVTGTSPVAHATAYAMAWEALLGLAVPPAGTYWRAVLAELERLHSHLGDLAGLANSTGLPAAAAELYVLKEQALRICRELTGHRYQRGLVAVGGLRAAPAAVPGLPDRLRAVLQQFSRNAAQLDRSTSFLDRLHGAGRVPPEAVSALRPVGPIGRASGLPYDVRRDRPYGLYAVVGAPAAVLGERGDAWARYRVRVEEVAASAQWLIERLAEGSPGGPLAAVSGAGGAGPPAIAVGRVEAPRGELVYLAAPGWVRCRPASAVNWAALPSAVAAGGVLQDVPIIDASFALSVSAQDR